MLNWYSLFLYLIKKKSTPIYLSFSVYIYFSYKVGLYKLDKEMDQGKIYDKNHLFGGSTLSEGT